MKLTKALWVYLASLTMFIIFSLIVLIALVGVRTISWNYINGFILSTIAMLIGIYILWISIKILIKTENHYFYYFMYLIRVACYFIPFAIAYFFYEGSIFSYYGILIGLLPVVTLPYLNAFIFKKTLSKKVMKGGNNEIIE